MDIKTGNGTFSFRCLSAGYFVGKAGWIYPRDHGGSFKLIYMLHGELNIQEGLSPFHLQPGDLLLLSSALPRFGMAPTDKKVSFYWTEFELSDPDALDLQVSCKVSTENRQISNLFGHLLLMKESYPEDAVNFAALLLMSETAAVQRNAAVRCPRVLQNITEWIRKNINTPLTAAEVGEHFSYNADYLTSLFKEYFGIGLKEYINDLKLKKAEEYLKTTDCPIKEIAAILGFASANQFIKYFSYHRGISPQRYRQRYYNQKM